MNSSHQRPYSPGNQQEMYYPASANQQMQLQDFGGSAIQTTTGCHVGLPMAFASPAQQQHIHRLPMGAMAYPTNYYHHATQMGASGGTPDCFPQVCNQGSVASGFITPVQQTNASSPVHTGGPLQGHLDHIDPRLCSQGSPVHYQGHVLYPCGMNNGQLSQASPGRSSTIAYHLKQPANHFIHSPSHPTISQSPTSSYCCPQSQQSQQTMLNGYMQQHPGQQLTQSPLRVNYNSPSCSMVGSRVVDPPSNYELIAINQACNNEGDYGYSPHYECSNVRRTPISPSTINSPYHQPLPDCNRLMQQQQQRLPYHHRELHASEGGPIGSDNTMNNPSHLHSQQQPCGEVQRNNNPSNVVTLPGASYDASASAAAIVQSTRELSRYQRAKLKNPYGSSLDALTRVMEIDESDPLRKQFAERMKQIWIEYSIKLRTLPTITKIPIDLYMLYKLVRERNGYIEVTMKKQWREVANILGIFHIQSAAFGVKRNYTKLGILRYECLYDLNGVDQEQILRDVEASKPPPSNRKRKRPSKTAKLPMNIAGGEPMNTLDPMNDENTMESPGSNSDSESPSVSRMSSGLLTNEDTPPAFMGCGSPCETSGYVYDKPWSSSMTDESPTPHLPSQRYAEFIPPPSSTGPSAYSGMPSNFQDNAGDHSTSVINSLPYRESPNQAVIAPGLIQSGVSIRENQQQIVGIESVDEGNKSSDTTSAFPSADSLVRPDEQAEKESDHFQFDRKFDCSTLSAALTAPGNVQYVTCNRSNVSPPRLTSQSPRMVYASAAPTPDSYQRQPRSVLPTFRLAPHGLNAPTFSIVRQAMSQNHLSYQTVPQTLNSLADRKRSKVLTTVAITSSAHPELVYNNVPVSFADSHNAAILGADFNTGSSPLMEVSSNGSQTIFIKTANRFIPAVPHSGYVNIPGHNALFVGNVRASNVARAFPVNQLHANSVRNDQIYVNYKETVRMQAPPVVHHLPQCPPSDALAFASVELSDLSADEQLSGQTGAMRGSQELMSIEEKPEVVGGDVKKDVGCTADPRVREHRIEELRLSMVRQQGRRRMQRKKLMESRVSPRRIALQLQSGLPYEVAYALGHINSLTGLPNEDCSVLVGDAPEMIDLTRYPSVICTLANALARGVKTSCLRNLLSSESECGRSLAPDQQSEDKGRTDECLLQAVDAVECASPLDVIASECDGDKLTLSASLAIRNLSFVQRNRQMMARNGLLCQTLSQLLCATVDSSDFSSAAGDGIKGIGTRISSFGRFYREHHMCVTVRENVLITLSNIAEALSLSVIAEGKAKMCRVLFLLCQVQEPMHTEPLICLNLLAIEIITKLLTFSLDNREYLHSLCQQQLADCLFETVAQWLVAGAMLENSSCHQLAGGRERQSEAMLAKAEMSVSLLLFLLDSGISDGCSQKVKSYFRPTDSVTCFRLMWALLLHLRQELQTPRPGAEKCALKCARAMFIVATHSKMIREKCDLQRDSRSTEHNSPAGQADSSDLVEEANDKSAITNESIVQHSQDNESLMQTGNADDPVVEASSPPLSDCSSQLNEGEHDTTNAEHEKVGEQMTECQPMIDQPNCAIENCTDMQNDNIDSGSEDVEKLADDDSTTSYSVPPLRVGSRMELRLKTRLVDTIFMVNCLTIGNGAANSFYDLRQSFQSSLRRRKPSSVAPPHGGVSVCVSSAQHQIAARIISMLSHCLRKLDPHR